MGYFENPVGYSPYKANSLFAKLDLADYSKPEESKNSEQNARKQNFTLGGGPQSLIDFNEEAAAANAKNKGRKVLAQYSIPIGASEATITFTGEKLAVEDFDALADYVAIFKKQFERKQVSEEREAAIKSLVDGVKADKKARDAQ